MLPSWWEKSQTSCTLERHPDNLRKSTWPGLGSGNVDEVGVVVILVEVEFWW